MPQSSSVRTDEILRILASIPFLGGFTEPELKMITDHFTDVSFERGESIIRKGEQPSHLYVVLGGRVELHIGDQETDIHKRTFEVGDHFGEVAMLSLVNETASFVAVENCDLLAFPISAFYRLRKDSPDIFGRIVLNLARDLARKVQYSDDLMLRG